jgi:hypothetical protein
VGTLLPPTIAKRICAVEPEGAKKCGAQTQIRLKPASLSEHF